MPLVIQPAYAIIASSETKKKTIGLARVFSGSSSSGNAICRTMLALLTMQVVARPIVCVSAIQGTMPAIRKTTASVGWPAGACSRVGNISVKTNT